ncbi:hypothetical protein [Pseudobutyrivibrio sp.]
MAKLRVTVVGQDIFKIVNEKFELVGINMVNQISTGMLGNLKTLTYEVDIPDEVIMAKRNEFMQKVGEDNMRLYGMFANGDWFRIFIFKPFKT